MNAIDRNNIINDMFSCCQAQSQVLKSPEKAHRNPIYQRLGKRNKKKPKHASSGLNLTLPTHHHSQLDHTYNEPVTVPTHHQQIDDTYKAPIALPTS